MSRRARTGPASGTAEGPTSGGQRYAEFIKDQLEREVERRSRLDSRAAGVVGSSTALSTALFAFAVFVRGTDAPVSAWGVRGVGLAGAALVVSCVLSIVILLPNESLMTRLGSLTAMVGDHWRDSEEEADHAIAVVTIRFIKVLRQVSGRRTRLLAWALWLQVGSVLLLTVVLAWELRYVLL